MTSIYDDLLKSADGRTALCIEQTITNVTELLCKLLEQHPSINRTALARRMGVTPGRITQLLDGKANLTLASVARALAAFDCVLEVNARKVDDMSSQCSWRIHHAVSPQQRAPYVRSDSSIDLAATVAPPALQQMRMAS